jgi:next-to-BRCA1 protein 1
MLGHVGGDKLSLVECVPVEPTQPGEERDVAVDMIAPEKPGRYVSYWRLIHPDGSRFGQRVWVDVIVIPNKVEEKATETVSQQQTSQATETVTQQQATQATQTVSNNNNSTASTATTASATMEVEKEEELSPQAKLIMEMGFTDRAAIQQALAKHGNDILKTVHELCGK